MGTSSTHDAPSAIRRTRIDDRPGSVVRVDSEPFPFVPFAAPHVSNDEAVVRGRSFFEQLDSRRSVRHFSDEPVPREAIDWAIRAASTAPSGAHMQPWTFVAVDDPSLKREIRIAAEEEERKSYQTRMSDEWRRALAPLGTDWHKPYLEIAPHLVVVFEQTTGIDDAGQPRKHYYVRESVGIACGLFIAALHTMGLCTLTHTPNPMAFLGRILQRPANERAFILFPVGRPAPDAKVPDLQRKPLDAVRQWNVASRG